MREFTIVLIIMIVTTLLGYILKIDNTVLNAIIVISPIAAPAISIFYNIPKNYLKLLSFKNLNIHYKYSIAYKGCNIEDGEFYKIYSCMCKEYGEKHIKEMNTLEGDGIYKKVITLKTTPMEIEYNNFMSKLYIEIEDELNYKSLIKRISKINNCLSQSFNKVEFDKSQINFKILFDSEKSIKNPFVEKFFGDFGDNCILNFMYKTERDTQIEITNDSILFISKSIDALKDDLNNELKYINKKK